jgi:hypothetical protein
VATGSLPDQVDTSAPHVVVLGACSDLTTVLKPARYLESGDFHRILAASRRWSGHAHLILTPSRWWFSPYPWLRVDPVALQSRALDGWFRGALSDVTDGYNWVDTGPGGGTSGALLVPEGSAASLRIWDRSAQARAVPQRDWLLASGNASATFDAAAKALRRFLAGVLLSLRLILIRVLYVLARLDEALAFVLVLIAVRLRFGHRDEPADYSSLLPRRYQRSAGCMPL